MASTAHQSAAEYTEHHDDAATLDRKVTQLAEWIRQSRFMLAFTGAGISTACGIPDFRSGMATCLPTGAGAWTLRAEEQKAGRRIEQPGVRRVGTLQAIPSHGHMALVELQRSGILRFLVTQNTDGLHRRSGFPTQALAELHGNTNLERCSVCRAEYLRDFRTRTARGVLEHDTGRACGKCGGMLRDTIINFSEWLPEEEIRKGFRAAELADLCLVLGSSLRVTPAANIPEIVGKKEKGKLVVVNLQSTPLDGLAALRINGTIDDVMQLLMSKLELQIPPFVLKRRVQISQWITSPMPTPTPRLQQQPQRVERSTRSTVAAASAPASAPSGPQFVMQVSGVEADGTPASLFREVRLGEQARSDTEPHRFTLRLPLTVEGAAPKLPASVSLVLIPFGNYREPPVTLTVPVQPASVQTWLLEYDPRSTGRWIRQELAATITGAEANHALEKLAGLPDPRCATQASGKLGGRNSSPQRTAAAPEERTVSERR